MLYMQRLTGRQLECYRYFRHTNLYTKNIVETYAETSHLLSDSSILSRAISERDSIFSGSSG